jgi:hypothetical protein
VNLRVSTVVIALLLPALVACATRSDFTAISSKNVNLSDIRIDRSKSKGRVQGEDCQRIIIIIPTSGPPTLDEALDRALEGANANLLLDAVVNFRSFYIPYIYGETCWEAEGEAYDTYR